MTYTQNTFEIAGHHAWLYLIQSDIGNIFAVQYEEMGFEIHTDLILDNLETAEKKFRSVCRMMIKKYCP